MNSEHFHKLKSNLVSTVEEKLLNDPKNQDSYQTLLKILLDITYSNKESEKGRISHFIADSYTGSKELGSKAIDFDSKI